MYFVRAAPHTLYNNIRDIVCVNVVVVWHGHRPRDLRASKSFGDEKIVLVYINQTRAIYMYVYCYCTKPYKVYNIRAVVSAQLCTCTMKIIIIIY